MPDHVESRHSMQQAAAAVVGAADTADVAASVFPLPIG